MTLLTTDAIARAARSAECSPSDWLHDEAVQCEICHDWYDRASDFDDELMAVLDGRHRWICHDCAADFADEEPYDMRREHGTLWARNGSVVG